MKKIDQKVYRQLVADAKYLNKKLDELLVDASVLSSEAALANEASECCEVMTRLIEDAADKNRQAARGQS